MYKKTVLSTIVIVFVVLAASGVYLGIHASKSKDSPHTPTTTVAKKTTYHATVSNSVFVTKSNSNLGQYLATPDGKPLYTYSKDTKGVSACTTGCLANWPAYKDTSPTGTSLPLNVSTLTRTDNSDVQFTYKGMPLYTYVRDSANKATGNGKDGFRLARL